jgi:glycosyltransferase involved in cell wall biosynthesis
MRILHLLAYYGNYLGGIQHSVKEVAKRQLSLGHEVQIIASDMFGVYDSIDDVRIKRSKTLFEAFRVPFMPTLPITLLKETCNVLHVYLPLPWVDICAALKKKLCPRTKLVLSIRNLLPDTTTIASKIAGGIHNNATIKTAIEAADAIVFTNDEFALSVPYKVPPTKKFIVPNGIDTEVFHPNPGYTFDKNQVLFVGRLIPEKGLKILMRAMRIVKAKHREARLVAVVSDYYNQKEYLRNVLELDNGFLELRSNLPIQELAQLYRDSAVFVLPSVGLESFGNVLVEAMASGCPVVCTDLAGPRGLVKSGSSFNVGTVVAKSSVEDLAKEIVRELQSNSRERREKITEFSRSRASWDTVAEQLISVYRKCGK